jgi:hypothetical protein
MTDDLSQKRELANAAKDLGEDPAFKQAILDLRKHWFNELMTAAHTKGERNELVAKLKALETLPAQLNVYIADYRAALKQQQKHA